MTEENGAITPELDTTTAAPEAALSSQEPAEQSRDWENEARASGWVPEAEFKGDKKPAKFLSAEEFVRRGEEIAPFIKRENAKLKAEKEKQDREFQERLARIERMSSESIKRLQEQHKAELDRIKAQKREAAAAGDVAKFDKLEEQQAELEKQAPKADPAPEKSGEPPELVAWKKDNAWFETDEDMQAYAYGISQKLAEANPSITLAENLRQTAERVKKAFPGKFEQTKPAQPAPAANGHAAVDGGSLFPAPKGKDSSFSKLPAEAQAQAKKDVAAGLYKDVEAWAKVYNS